MIDSLQYLLQASLVFSLLYLAYRLVLSRLTFHAFNRYLLLAFVPLSLLLPVVPVLFPALPSISVDVPVYEGIPFVGGQQVASAAPTAPAVGINYGLILGILYCCGVGFILLKLVFGIRKLTQLKRHAEIQEDQGHKIIFTKGTETFSFFNWIFIPKESELKSHPAIVAHEKAHVRLRHSLDVVFSECYVALFWFNPLVYLYRRSLKSVHEFQADGSVLNSQMKTSHYLELLLQNMELSPKNSAPSYFNYPILKRRIDMITKSKSTPFAKLKYLVVLPICVVFCFAFEVQTPEIISAVANPTNSLVVSNLPSLFPVEGKSKEDITAFFGVKHNHPDSKKEKMHGGIDIKASVGTPVLAAADGTIAKAADEGKWGNLIVIAHADGYETWYAHLQGFNSEESQTVKKGDVIGYVGMTGLSRNPHLHYEVKLNGERVDPVDYLTE